MGKKKTSVDLEHGGVEAWGAEADLILTRPRRFFFSFDFFFSSFQLGFFALAPVSPFSRSEKGGKAATFFSWFFGHYFLFLRKLKETLCFFGDTLSTPLSPHYSARKGNAFLFSFFQKRWENRRLSTPPPAVTPWLSFPFAFSRRRRREERGKRRRRRRRSRRSLSLSSLFLSVGSHTSERRRRRRRRKGCKDMRQRARAHTRQFDRSFFIKMFENSIYLNKNWCYALKYYDTWHTWIKNIYISMSIALRTYWKTYEICVIPFLKLKLGLR